MGRRTALIVATCAVLALALPAAPAAGDPDDARLTVTDVTVSPATPVTGAPVEFDVTLRNSAGSPSPVELDYVALRTAGGEELLNVTDLGTLSAGDTLGVPLSTNFSRPGERRLRLVAAGTDEDGDRTRVSRPVSVVIEQAPPQLSVRTSRAVAGATTTVSVTVANPTEAQVRNLTISAGGEGVEPVDGRAALPSLAAGDTATVNLTVRPTGPGAATVDVDLSYTTAAGSTASTGIVRAVRVAPVETDVGVAVAPQREDDQQQAPTNLQGLLTGAGGGSTTQQDEDRRPTRVEVTVTNFGNAPVSGLVVTPRIGDRALPRRAVDATLPPGESASVVVDLSSVRQRGEVTFEVTYRTAGRQASATATYPYRPPAGSIRLTGVELAFEDGHLVVQGNAGNVGSADVDGLVLSVGDGEYVDPAYPRRTYFVGTVEGSEFAPFELTADVDRANVSTIPVTVEYTVDGFAVSRTIEVPYDEDVAPEDDGGGGIPWLPVAGVLVLVLAVGAGAYAVGRRQGSEP